MTRLYGITLQGVMATMNTMYLFTCPIPGLKDAMLPYYTDNDRVPLNRERPAGRPARVAPLIKPSKNVTKPASGWQPGTKSRALLFCWVAVSASDPLVIKPYSVVVRACGQRRIIETVPSAMVKG